MGSFRHVINICSKQVQAFQNTALRYSLYYYMVLFWNQSYIKFSSLDFCLFVSTTIISAASDCLTSPLCVKYIIILMCLLVSAWILSRNTTLHPEILDKATIELNSLPYASIAYLRTVNQDTEQCKFHWTAHVNSEDRAGYYEYI